MNEGPVHTYIRRVDQLSLFPDFNLLLEVHVDEDPMNPRTEWDNLGTMVCWHKRYNLGDEHKFPSPEDFEEYLKSEEMKGAVLLPIYLYDHSGITIRTKPFSCHWDSGQVGWIYATLDTIRQEYSRERISRQRRRMVSNILEGEIEIYDSYLRGEVYGFILYEGTEEVDSCWGFYGDDILGNILPNISSEYNNPDLWEELS